MFDGESGRGDLGRHTGYGNRRKSVNKQASGASREYMIPKSAVLLALVTLAWAQTPPVAPHDSIFKDTLVEMSWPQVKEAGQRHAIVLFPIGVVEEHGPHMDLSPDIILACMMSRNLKAQLAARGIEAVIAPPYYWGITDDTSEFPGSFSVQPETMKTVLKESIANLGRWGFERVYLVNLHGNRKQGMVVRTVAEEMTAAGPMKVLNFGGLLAGPRPAAKPGKFSPDYHSGADETKTIWDYYPAKVNVEVAKKLEPQKGFLPLGYAGDPARFMEYGEGREDFEKAAQRAAEHIAKQLKAESQSAVRP